MRFLFLLLFISFSVWASDEVFFAPSPFDGSQQPFCVSWATAGMPETHAESRGGEVSYSCKIDFNYRVRRGDFDYSPQEETGSHTFEYRSVRSGRNARTEALRSRLSTGLGYIVRTERDGNPTIEIVGANLQRIFPGVRMMNEVFSFDLRPDMVQLKPKFAAANVAQQLACQVVALELLQHACIETERDLRDDILNRLRSTFHWNEMRRGLIPQ